MIKLKDLVEGKDNWDYRLVNPILGNPPQFFQVRRPTLDFVVNGKKQKGRKGAYIFFLKQGTFYVDPDKKTVTQIENENPGGSPMNLFRYGRGELSRLSKRPISPEEFKSYKHG